MREKLSANYECIVMHVAEDQDLSALSSLIEKTMLSSSNPNDQSTLQTAQPQAFSEFVSEFDSMVEKCLAQRFYRVSQPVSAELSSLAMRLGTFRAGPRDVVEVYGTCLKKKVRDAARTKGAAYADVGQLLALELMGYLVSYYRNLTR